MTLTAEQQLEHLQRVVRAQTEQPELSSLSVALAFERNLRWKRYQLLHTLLYGTTHTPDLRALIDPESIVQAIHEAAQRCQYGDATKIFASVAQDARLSQRINKSLVAQIIIQNSRHGDIVNRHFITLALEVALTNPERWVAPSLTPERVAAAYAESLAQDDTGTALKIHAAMASYPPFAPHAPEHSVDVLPAAEGEKAEFNQIDILFDRTSSKAYVALKGQYARSLSERFVEAHKHLEDKDPDVVAMGQDDLGKAERAHNHFTAVVKDTARPDWVRDVARAELASIPTLKAA